MGELAQRILYTLPKIAACQALVRVGVKVTRKMMRNSTLVEAQCAIQKVEKISENTYSVSTSCEKEGDQEDRMYAVTFRDSEVILDLGYEVFSFKDTV